MCSYVCESCRSVIFGTSSRLERASTADAFRGTCIESLSNYMEYPVLAMMQLYICSVYSSFVVQFGAVAFLSAWYTFVLST